MFRSIIAFFALAPSIACAQLYGTVDFMVPTRIVTDENVFQRNEINVEVPPPVVTDPPTPSTFINEVGDTSLLRLDLDFVAAGRATVGFKSETIGLEGSFFRTDQWNATSSVADANGLLASPFTAPGSEANPRGASDPIPSTWPSIAGHIGRRVGAERSDDQ